MILTPIIVNRSDPATPAKIPEWIHFAPLGEFPVTVGDKHYVQVIDDSACTLLANSLATAGTAGLLIDYDHFSADADHSSEAAAWLKELQVRPNGLWGRVEWTDHGADAVRNRRFLFISPTWRVDDCQQLDGDRIRPTRLRNAALTNAPNLIGIRPIVNRLPANAAQDPTGINPDKPQQGVPMDYKAKLIALLSLTADATDDQITAALTAKTAAPATEPTAANSAALEEVTKDRDVLKKKVADLVEAQVEIEVEKDLEENKDVIANPAEAKKVLLANRELGLAMLKALRNPDTEKNIHNRSGARPPATAGNDSATQADQQKSTVMIIKNREKCTNQKAWDIARAEKPELFRAAK